LLFIFDTLDKD